LNARSTRILLIAVLFLALPPGATLAACLQSGPSPCCCPECPKPGDVRIDTGSCCEMSERAPLPTPTTAVPAPTKPLDDTVDPINTAVTTVSSVDTLQDIKPVGGLPSPVPLFTLHAALLI